MGKGWITLDRQIEDNWLWQDKPFSKGQAWIDLIIIVNHSDEKVPFDGGFYDLKRGQKLTSLVKLSDRWGWSTKKTSNFLNCLAKDKMLSQKRDTKKTVLTLLNYDKYQSGEMAKEQQKKNRGTAEEKQGKTNNNDITMINNEEQKNGAPTEQISDGYVAKRKF